MKRLRILTGVHAGAQVRLTPGMHRIGNDDDSDIRISDWQGQDLLLAVDDEGLVTAQRIDPGAAPDAAADAPQAGEPIIDPGCVLLVDFAPMRFGDTALCIGWEDAAWPSDIDLLSTLLVKTETPPRQGGQSRVRNLIGIGLACVALTALIVIGSTLMTTQVSHAAAPRETSELLHRVNALLATANQPELHAQAAGSMVKITGIVATSADDLIVRKALEPLGAASVARQYDVAANDARSIEESLGIPELHVAYAGRGVFDVTGKVANAAAANAAISRVRVDLDENVKDLRDQVTEIGRNTAPSFSELVLSNAVQYAETPDGIKHIYTPPASDAAALSVADAGLTPAAGQAAPSGVHQK
jgi:type III secretion protein D